MRTCLSLLLLCCLFSACTPSDTIVEQANQDSILILGNGTEPEDLDPHITTGLNEFYIHQALFEGLIALDPRTLDPIPAAAQSWDISPDQLTYTFHLRPGLKWSNGDPLTAQDFAFSLQRILSAALGAEYAFMVYPIAGAEAFHQGKISFTQVGIDTPDPRTLVLTLHQPVPYFLATLDHPTWYPIHPPTILQFGDIAQRGTGWTHRQHVSNGPFTLKSWKVSDSVELIKNPHYWDASQVALNGITFSSLENNSTEERVFRAQQLHATSNIPKSKIHSYQKAQSPYLRSDPDLGTYYYLFNTKKAPLDQLAVRQALSLTVERELIAHHIRGRGEAVASHLTPPGTGTGNYTAPKITTTDFEQARQLLAQAGFPGGQNFPTLTLLYNTSEEHKAIAEAVQQMWKKELGIHIELKNQEWKVYLDSRTRGDFDICRASWFGDYNDPTTFLDLFRSNNGLNQGGWIQPQYDQLLDQAALATHNDQRNPLLQQAEALMLKESPIIPFFFYNKTYLIQPSVQNWPKNVLSIRRYKDISLKPVASSQ